MEQKKQKKKYNGNTSERTCILRPDHVKSAQHTVACA